MTAPTPGGPRVLLLGGTGEARRLACALTEDAGCDVLYSLAGRVRDPRVPPSCRVRVGGFGGPDGLAALLRAERIDTLIDATHPFAARMSASAATAAAATGHPLLVLRRPGWRERPGDHWQRVPSPPAAVDLVERFIPDRRGAGTVAGGDPPRVFLTTGRGDLALFARLDRPWFLIRCVEPPDPALPPRRAILLDRGPFDVDAERDLLRRHRIDAVVTKDSGGSMTAAKLTAARELGLPVIMIDRPPVPAGVDVVNSVEAALRWLAGCTDAG
ncbi:cobalt-precorrin-6A reductase [Frankia sp. AgKG'84/4]|uniref:cobalt-precorrin-6A reductase n=1 Tax=Frankia sp. AgKG'84/4 TaxID=573490 RepID=UPI00200D1D14|nr:cobalt-precorrin-6A reductase [Frankia sp. AgKG'84/4]MCL9794229.1 cobalt-precorrin-6A reductase [Frankia sp. AgKG'84/4]